MTFLLAPMLLLFAGLLVMSGVRKLLAPHQAATFVRVAFGMPPKAARSMILGFSLWEIALGATLAVGWRLAYVLPLSLGLVAVLLAVRIVGRRRAPRVPCGCFGTSAAHPRVTTGLSAHAVLLLAVAVLWRTLGQEGDSIWVKNLQEAHSLAEGLAAALYLMLAVGTAYCAALWLQSLEQAGHATQSLVAACRRIGART